MTTTITRVINAGGGGDFTTLQGAWDAISTLVGSFDLVAEDTNVVFEVVAGTYTEDLNFAGSLTTDATRNVVFLAQSGSEHGGVSGAGVVVTNSSGRTLTVSTNYTRIEGLEFTGDGDRTVFLNSTKGTVIDSCLIHNDDDYALFAYGLDDTQSDVVQNCIISCVGFLAATVYNDSPQVPRKTILNNNTFVAGSNYGLRVRTAVAGATTTAELNNNLFIGEAYQSVESGTNVVTGRGNVGGIVSALPAAVQAESTTWTLSTDEAATGTNLFIYDASTYKPLNVAGNDGLGVGDATVAPALDIAGNERNRNIYCDPGALTSDRTESVITIGDTGDHLTLLDMSGSLESDALAGCGSLNIAQRNHQLRYNLQVQTHSLEPANVSPANSPKNGCMVLDAVLTTGVNNRLIFTCADEDRHNGVWDAGPIVERLGTTGGTASRTWTTEIDHTTFEALQFNIGGSLRSAVGFERPHDGGVVKDCLFQTVNGTLGGFAVNVQTDNTALQNPDDFIGVTVMNTVTRGFYTSFAIYANTGGVDTLAKLTEINNIHSVAIFNILYSPNINATGANLNPPVPNLYHDAYNVVHVAGSAPSIGGGVDDRLIKFGGEGNWGPNGSFLVPYNVATPTNNTSPGAGDFIVYDADTYNLIYDIGGAINTAQGQGIEPPDSRAAFGIEHDSTPARFAPFNPGPFAFAQGQPNATPLPPTAFNPVNLETGVDIELESLSWVLDPDTQPVQNINVSLGYSPGVRPNILPLDGSSAALLDDELRYGSAHYWQLVLSNDVGTYTSPEFVFSVIADPNIAGGPITVTPTEYVLTGNLGFEYRKSRSRRWDTREGDIRERIFKMTQREHNISHIYKESLRSMIASFNDIVTIDDEQKLKEIKVYHANAERAIAKLSQENNIILPIISISQTVSQDDTDRRRYESVLVHEKYWDEEEHRAKRIVSLAPTAVTINYQINIWCKYMSDMDQIVEQIRLKFNPEMNVPTQQSTLAKAMLGGEDDVGSLVAQDKQDRILQKSFAVSLRTYVENPKFLLTNTGEIERFIIDTDA